MAKNELLKGLTEEQISKVKACKKRKLHLRAVLVRISRFGQNRINGFGQRQQVCQCAVFYPILSKFPYPYFAAETTLRERKLDSFRRERRATELMQPLVPCVQPMVS